MSRFPRLALAIAVASLGIVAAMNAPRAAAFDIPSPAGLPLVFDGQQAIAQIGQDGLGWQRLGSWQIRTASYAHGRLSFSVHIQPPATGLPGASGPAVLFARLSLFGGVGGDVGWEKQASPITWVAMSACLDESTCAYDGTITLPTAGLTGAGRLQPDLDGPAAIVNFSLVRSFGQGRWLQELPMFPEDMNFKKSGTVGEPLTVSGPVLSFGAFPASHARPSRYPNEGAYDFASVVERARDHLGDPSSAIPTVSADFQLTASDCRGWTVAVHDADGNFALNTRIWSAPVHERIELVAGRQWMVTVHGGAGVFEGTRDERFQVAAFETTGDDLAIKGEVTCRPSPLGSMSVVPATLPPTDLVVVAEAVSPSPLSALPIAFFCAIAAFFVLWLGRRNAPAELRGRARCA